MIFFCFASLFCNNCTTLKKTVLKKILSSMQHSSKTLIINFISMTILAFFIFPEAGKNYSGFWNGFVLGGFHGAGIIQNWLFHFYNPAHLLKAEVSSFWYGFSWWTSMLGQIISVSLGLYNLIRK